MVLNSNELGWYVPTIGEIHIINKFSPDIWVQSGANKLSKIVFSDKKKKECYPLEINKMKQLFFAYVKIKRQH